MNWISVNDRLPENEDVVAVICEYGIVSAYFCRSDDEYYSNQWIINCPCGYLDNSPNNVTHWMPLPELPKMDE
jgi:hypothetical protein